MKRKNRRKADPEPMTLRRGDGPGLTVDLAGTVEERVWDGPFCRMAIEGVHGSVLRAAAPPTPTLAERTALTPSERASLANFSDNPPEWGTPPASFDEWAAAPLLPDNIFGEMPQPAERLCMARVNDVIGNDRIGRIHVTYPDFCQEPATSIVYLQGVPLEYCGPHGRTAADLLAYGFPTL